MYQDETRELLKSVGRSVKVMKSVADQLREADLPHLAALLEIAHKDLSGKSFVLFEDTQPIHLDTSTL